MINKSAIWVAMTVLLVMLPAAGLMATPRPGERQGTLGPDITVLSLEGLSHFGAEAGVHSYAVGITSCNIGNEPLWWCDDPADATCQPDQHPVIAQNLYRLKDGRFEQLGMSWLKHGLVAANAFDADCGTCTPPTHGSDQLGTGCIDASGSALNGSRPLGLRSEVDAAAGSFPFPYTEMPFAGALDQRLRVEETDLDPILNPGARYWVEGHHVAADDAVAGNAANNASYREVTVQSDFDLAFTGNTVREQAAIHAWQAVDPRVDVVAVDILGTATLERFHVARKITVTPGNAYYEYAVHNLSADRSASSFVVEFPAATQISNVGFRDVDHHSGEPYATTDWTIEVDGGTVTWSTDDFDTDVNANALRWGTLFSFWFDADAPAEDAVQTLGLFKPGSPMEVPVLLPTGTIFADGFESGDTLAWN